MENSGLGFVRVINCSLEYDAGTEVGDCAAWGGIVYDPYWDCVINGLAEDFCLFTPVRATTWGNVKTLFR